MDTIPYRGVRVQSSLTGNDARAIVVYRWRCGRCKRLGPVQDRAKAEAGKLRHEVMHAAQDAAAQTARAFSGEPVR